MSITIVPSTEKDIATLRYWMDVDIDPTHHCADPFWWITGSEGSLLCFCTQDSEGPLCYVRLDPKDSDGLIRLHTQFAPRDQVSKLRLVGAMLKCFPMVQLFCRQQSGSGIIFQSTSMSLIDFMKRKFGFEQFSQDQFIWRTKEG